VRAVLDGSDLLLEFLLRVLARPRGLVLFVQGLLEAFLECLNLIVASAPGIDARVKTLVEVGVEGHELLVLLVFVPLDTGVAPEVLVLDENSIQVPN